MGAGRTLRRAIADVRTLPPEAPEHRLALPILVRLRLEISADPAQQTTIDREFLMTTQEIDKYLAQVRDEGRYEGFAQAVLAAYEARFGAPPAAVVAAVTHAVDHAELQRLLVLVITGSAAEVDAALGRSGKGKRGAVTAGRQRVSPRRVPASR
jgi:hypothetical protein